MFSHFFSSVKRFFSPIKRWGGLFLVALWVTLTSSIALYETFVIQAVIRDLENHEGSIFLFWIGSYALLSLTVWIIGWWLRPKTEAVLIEIKQQVYNATMPTFFRLDQQSLTKLGTGKTQEILLYGMDALGSTIFSSVYTGFGVIITVTTSLILIFSRSMIAGGIAFFLIFTSLLWIIIRNRVEKVKRRESKEDYILISQALIRQVMHVFEIIQSGKESREIEKISHLRNHLTNNQVSLERYKYITYQSMRLSSIMVWCILGGFVGMMVKNGDASIADYVFISGLFGLITTSLFSLSEWLRSFTREIVHIEKLWEFFDTTPCMIGYDEGVPFTLRIGTIEVEKIDFSYEDEKIFTDFSITIEGGKKTAFVGPSGGGKTTLMKLLAGYMRPESGAVSVDGLNLMDTKLRDYYHHIGYLTQEPSVFDGTIRENLTYALDSEPEESELNTIIYQSECHFIYEWKKGLDTTIGERGIRLSGGQKQRLAIAKIMLKNPDIIFLDEPTSALDSLNEELVNRALHNLFQGKTVVIIAHRLQTVKEADRIVYIEGGRVVEDGTHESLIAHNGKYKKMLDLQSGF